MYNVNNGASLDTLYRAGMIGRYGAEGKIFTALSTYNQVFLGPNPRVRTRIGVIEVVLCRELWYRGTINFTIRVFLSCFRND